MPKTFPTPIVIVQHMATGFGQGFMEWLAQPSALPVHLASHGDVMLPCHVYLAPDEMEMKVARHDRIVLTQDMPENSLRPSVSSLFRSVADVYGRDGAEELRLLKEKGAVTFVQDKDSSVVHGTPGGAIRRDSAMLVLPPEKIAAVLTSIANNGHARWRNR